MRPTASRLLKIRLLPHKEVSPGSLRLPPVSLQQANQQRKVESASTVATKLVDTMTAEKGVSWPANLRIEAGEKKTLFWKVPKERRTQLKRLLRET